APLAEAGKLSAFLVQLSPAFTPRHNALEELDTVLGALAPHRVAVELRHHGWARRDRVERVGTYLARWNAAWVHSDAATSRLGYVRLRGTVDEDALHLAASRARALARQGREVHVYVSARGAEGPRAAQRLRELVGQVAPACRQLRLVGCK